MLVLSLASTLTQYMIAYTIKLLHCTQRSFALCISAPFERSFYLDLTSSFEIRIN